MLDATRYYTDLEKLLLDVGKYVMILALWRDLRTTCPSPDSLTTLTCEFDCDMERLGAALDHLYKKAPKDWLLVRDFLKGIDDYDEEDALRFTKLIQRARHHTDFRAKALEWTRRQITRIEKGEDVPIYNLHDYLTSYDYLVHERRKESGRRFKGLHKSV